VSCLRHNGDATRLFHLAYVKHLPPRLQLGWGLEIAILVLESKRLLSVRISYKHVGYHLSGLLGPEQKLVRVRVVVYTIRTSRLEWVPH
jgi:hypothetical protein